MMKRKLLQLTVLLILLVNLVSTFVVLYETERTLRSATARATQDTAEGVVTFCLNEPPSSNHQCNLSLRQGVPFFCDLNVTSDPGDSFTFTQIPQLPDTVPVFNITGGGTINFTPTNDDVGGHSTLIIADDGSPCGNSAHSFFFDFTVANVNDPPYLVQNIPNQAFLANSTLYAFYLNDYFADPDGDELTYTYLQSASSDALNVTITSDSIVILRSGKTCGNFIFLRFFATDPFALSATSNNVRVEITCPEIIIDDGDDDGGSGGGGGGGGGAGRTCRSELFCLPWSECYPNGMQHQVCKDKNGCIDAEVDFYQDCFYTERLGPCEENWLCTDWGVCSPLSVQNRSCTDLRSCGSRTYRPALEQSCVYLPRCDDGVMNGNETGVDCGGECAPCTVIQQPGVVIVEASEATLLPWVLLLIILSVLLALFMLYREQLYERMASLGWRLQRRREKELLLSDDEKRVLFEQLRALHDPKRPLTPAAAYDALAKAVRTYYSFILKLPYEYALEEWRAAFDVLLVSDDLRVVLDGVHSRLALLESPALDRSVVNSALFTSVEEEFRLLICLTSNYSLEEVERALPVRHLTDELSFGHEARLRLLNAYEALQFGRVELAKEEYARILHAYANASRDDKAALYADIERLYREIGYVAGTDVAGTVVASTAVAGTA